MDGSEQFCHLQIGKANKLSKISLKSTSYNQMVIDFFQSIRRVRKKRAINIANYADVEKKSSTDKIHKLRLYRNDIDSYELAVEVQRLMEKILRSQYIYGDITTITDLLMLGSNNLAAASKSFLLIWNLVLRQPLNDFREEYLGTAEELVFESMLTAELCLQWLRDKRSTNNH